MRILVIANKDPHLDVMRVVEDMRVDIIITLGELNKYDIAMFSLVNDVPKLGIYGSQTSDHYMDEIGITNIDGMSYEHLRLKFNGISANSSHGLLRDATPSDILVSHNGPAGITGETAANSLPLQTYISAVRPKLVIYAHSDIHSSNISFDYDGTSVEYVNGSKIITI